MGLNDVKDTLVLSKCSASQYSLTFAESFWPTKLKIVIELISELNKSRFVCWKLQFKIAVAKFLEI
jgi:hypothetical protein